MEISPYVLSFLFFLQRGQSSWKHSRILGRDRGGGVSLFLAKSFSSFFICFSYSFDSDAFFGWQDIFLPTFALLYVCRRIPILVVLEFSWKDVLLLPNTDLWWIVSNMQPKRSRKNTTCVARKHTTSRISHSIQSFYLATTLCFSKYIALFPKTKLAVLFLETNTYLFSIS